MKQPLLLNQKQAAEVLGLSTRTVNRLLKSGLLRKMNMKGVHIPRHEIDRFVREGLSTEKAA